MTIQQARLQLSPRQLKFCNGILRGLNQGKAYEEAYGKKDYASASKLAKKAKVSQYMDLALAQETQAVVLTRVMKRERLAAIALDQLPSKDISPGEMIQAIKTDNEMTGDNKPVRIEGEITLGGILSTLKGTTGLPTDS